MFARPTTGTSARTREPMNSQGATVAAKVHVRLFAALRERAGWAERSLSFPSGGVEQTPAGLWRQLGLDPSPPAETGHLPAGIRVAVNHAFAAPDTPLAPGDEVAFLPPITGG
ncbi:MAG: hypothetical protein ER33_10480 [Cyanobium sp. CACIAM 14]|nr:MAG: hypothetical protein ER33_10480 [Cyanobium sp. CACIAM 14]